VAIPEQARTREVERGAADVRQPERLSLLLAEPRDLLAERGELDAAIRVGHRNVRAQREEQARADAESRLRSTDEQRVAIFVVELAERVPLGERERELPGGRGGKRERPCELPAPRADLGLLEMNAKAIRIGGAVRGIRIARCSGGEGGDDEECCLHGAGWFITSQYSPSCFTASTNWTKSTGFRT
jgi:hypothetical protein